MHEIPVSKRDLARMRRGGPYRSVYAVHRRGDTLRFRCTSTDETAECVVLMVTYERSAGGFAAVAVCQVGFDMQARV
jgi:hypothetical protein